MVNNEVMRYLENTSASLKQNILQQDELFARGDAPAIWSKYCGFMELSLEEFMIIQETLLLEEIELASNSEIGQKIMRGRQPKTIEQFRRNIPLTTYEDYEPFLSERKSDAMPAEPVIWAHTSGRTGFIKWLPYTQNTVAKLADSTIAAIIMSSAARRGDVRLREGARAIMHLPPLPYTTAIMAHAAAQRIAYQPIPPLDKNETADFEERIKSSFAIALHTGADYAASIAVVLAKVGERFEELGKSTIKRKKLSLSPPATLRVAKAFLRSKLSGRELLPKDIWQLKGLVCGGTDTAIYRDQIEHSWGVQPLDVYVATETCYIAMQGWDKTGMTFVPDTNFYEFIPEEECKKSRADKTYQPRSMLLNEVKEGEVYELVVTNFHGGPLLRYRIGDLIKIVSLRNDKTGVSLPQMVFQSRADDIIDIAGFARLDEKTIWQAIHSIGVPYEDWTARKENNNGKTMLHIYLELYDNELSTEEITDLINQRLVSSDKDLSDLETITELRPLTVTLLERGSFQRQTERKLAAGLDFAHLKPRHINATEADINELIGHPVTSR